VVNFNMQLHGPSVCIFRRTQILLEVPDGYQAYYTVDGSTPSPGVGTTMLAGGPVPASPLLQAVAVNSSTSVVGPVCALAEA
jgi:hypothetical protein